MKKGVLERNEVTDEMAGLFDRLVAKIPWPARRAAMGEVTLEILDGSPRLAESIFGWSRSAVKLGIEEFQSGMSCVDDVSFRRRKKAEEKNPQLLVDIQKLLDPHSHADYQLRTDLAHRNITAQAVWDSLVESELPTVRTISNILNRHGYRVRSVAKTKVQKKARNRRHFRESQRIKCDCRCLLHSPSKTWLPVVRQLGYPRGGDCSSAGQPALPIQ